MLNLEHQKWFITSLYQVSNTTFRFFEKNQFHSLRIKQMLMKVKGWIATKSHRKKQRSRTFNEISDSLQGQIIRNLSPPPLSSVNMLFYEGLHSEPFLF